MTAEDWRVDVELDDERHPYSLGERLRALDLDDEARKRVGGRVVVSRKGSKLFLYARTRDAAQEAERIVRELLAGDRLSANLRTVRWHPDAEEWQEVAVPLPRTEAEREAEREQLEDRKRAEVAAGGTYDWTVEATAPDRAAAVELERRLRARELAVERHWRFVTVRALTRDRANEAAALILELSPDAEVVVEPIIDEPSFVLARTLF